MGADEKFSSKNNEKFSYLKKNPYLCAEKLWAYICKSFVLYDNASIEHIMLARGYNLESMRRDASISTEEELRSMVNQCGNESLLEEDINKPISNDCFA